MKTVVITAFLSFVLCSCTTAPAEKITNDRANIVETNNKIRAAFASGNIEEILKYHHPEVEKAFSWNDYQVGSKAVKQGLTSILENYNLEFLGSAEDMESLKIFDDSAVMIARFSLKGTPKNETARSFVFSGRTMIVYVKDKRSPTGWLSFREMITPEK
jgi:hypothetical protein